MYLRNQTGNSDMYFTLSSTSGIVVGLLGDSRLKYIYISSDAPMEHYCKLAEE